MSEALEALKERRAAIQKDLDLAQSNRDSADRTLADAQARLNAMDIRLNEEARRMEQIDDAIARIQVTEPLEAPEKPAESFFTPMNGAVADEAAAPVSEPQNPGNGIFGNRGDAA